MAVPEPITHFQILDSALEGNWSTFADGLAHVFMPSMALALGVFGYISRVLRASILEVSQTSYIRSARAKGLDENAVFFRHGLRNAMIPVVTVASLLMRGLVASTIFVENIFSYPGLGQYAVEALTSLDYPAILAITLIFAVVTVLANLVADILYAVVDPEIRLR